jgi:hypothetical protein
MAIINGEKTRPHFGELKSDPAAPVRAYARGVISG